MNALSASCCAAPAKRRLAMMRRESRDRRDFGTSTAVARRIAAREGFAMRLRNIVLGGLVLVGSFAAALFLMNQFSPQTPQQAARPALVAMPPLLPLTSR